jgi:NAD(P)-dependent dehydrogenase (short-subunit alcohol dehydrogenase family)
MALESNMNTGSKRRRALVTGGANGIGRAICERLAADGCSVAIADINSDAAEQLASALEGAHVVLPVDLTDAAAASALPGRAAAVLGGLDIVVNNAAVTDSSGQTLVNLPQAAFDRLVAVNLTALERVSTAATEILQPGSAIVNIASGAAYRPLALRGPYSATKTGVVAFTAAHALALSERGISVAAVAPGYTLTPLVEELEREGRVDLEKVVATIPMGRLATPKDIASAVAFAASAAGRAISGQTLPVDGGGSMGPPALQNTAPARGNAAQGKVAFLGSGDRLIMEAVRLADLDALANAGPLAAVVDATSLNSEHTPTEVLLRALSTAKACAALTNRASEFSLVFVTGKGNSPSACAAAAALAMLSRTLALEWAGSAMRVNTISWRGQSLHGLGELCGFLSGAEGGFVTGQLVDAGHVY